MQVLVILALTAVGFSTAIVENEPHCACSKFHYEEKLLEKMVRMEFAVEKMKHEMENAKRTVEKTVEEFNDVEKKLKLLTENTVPAFSARLSTHMLKLGRSKPIVFDDIVTNAGHAYSHTSGVFTAPRNGVYFFTATVMSHSGQYIQTEIVKNGQSMVKMYSNDRAHEQGTNGVVLELVQSDEVWVRHINNEGENVYGYNWSTFSGFQIA